MSAELEELRELSGLQEQQIQELEQQLETSDRNLKSESRSRAKAEAALDEAKVCAPLGHRHPPRSQQHPHSVGSPLKRRQSVGRCFLWRTMF